MTWGQLRTSWYPDKLRALLSLFLVAALLAAAACRPPAKPAPPSFRIPSKVVTEEGIEYSVFGLKLPGTSQELKLKGGGTTTWVPLAIMQVLTFSGPEDDRFRPVDIVLISGEKLKGDLFVGQIIEGTTDLGYWNTSLGKVRQIGFGAE
jgi:hypothetical protein